MGETREKRTGFMSVLAATLRSKVQGDGALWCCCLGLMSCVHNNNAWIVLEAVFYKPGAISRIRSSCKMDPRVLELFYEWVPSGKTLPGGGAREGPTSYKKHL